MFLALLNHLCLLAPSNLGLSQDRELGLGLGPCCTGGDLAVTGLSSAGSGSQAAAAAEDLWGGEWPCPAHHSPSTVLDLRRAQGGPSAVRQRLWVRVVCSEGLRTVTAGHLWAQVRKCPLIQMSSSLLVAPSGVLSNPESKG